MPESLVRTATLAQETKVFLGIFLQKKKSLLF
jgi:hypothetical protein